MAPEAEYLKDRFCPSPFEHLDISRSPDNLAFACCPAWVKFSLGSMNTPTPMEVWNSQAAQDLRAAIHDGSFRHCNTERCPRIQSRSLPARSVAATQPAYRKIIEQKLLVLDKGPRHLNLASDRSCNLSCPSCRTQKIMVNSGPEYQQLKSQTRSWLQQFIPDLKLLVVTGSGDAFASRVYRELLTELDGRHYPQLRINLVTNGLLLDESMWKKMWKIHDNIQTIIVSFDAATAETYSQVRRGGQFAQLLANMGYLQRLRQQGANFKLRFDFVVQSKNYREMPGFVEWGLKFACDEMLFQKIINWGTFSDQDFFAQAVYLPQHPEHSDFLQVVQSTTLKIPKVNMGNLSVFMN